jgi:hypothetical protein
MSDTRRPTDQQEDRDTVIGARLSAMSPEQVRLIRESLIRHRATLDELARR